MISLISCEFNTKSTQLFVHGYKIQQLFEKLLKIQQLCDIILMVSKCGTKTAHRKRVILRAVILLYVL